MGSFINDVQNFFRRRMEGPFIEILRILKKSKSRMTSFVNDPPMCLMFIWNSLTQQFSLLMPLLTTIINLSSREDVILWFFQSCIFIYRCGGIFFCLFHICMTNNKYWKQESGGRKTKYDVDFFFLEIAFLACDAL